MRKILGIAALLFLCCAVTALMNEAFRSPVNVENLLRRTSLYGVLGIGVSFVIVAGGIDLSIGSMVGLVGCLLPFLLARRLGDLDPGLAGTLGIGGLLLLSTLLGLLHGVLVTKVKLQPFIVTLCGLLLYRGAVRGIIGDESPGFGNGWTGMRWIAIGRIPLPGIEGFALPAAMLVLLVLALIAAWLLDLTVFGRWLQALGRNPEAARLSGVPVDRVVIGAYAFCSFCAGLGGILFVLDNNLAKPSDFGNFFELYAIAAAVLGGCALRGGEGSILGVVLGTAILRVLPNLTKLFGFPDQLEFALIGAVILVGVTADEGIRRLLLRRRGSSGADQVTGRP